MFFQAGYFRCPSAEALVKFRSRLVDVSGGISVGLAFPVLEVFPDDRISCPNMIAFRNTVCGSGVPELSRWLVGSFIFRFPTGLSNFSPSFVHLCNYVHGGWDGRVQRTAATAALGSTSNVGDCTTTDESVVDGTPAVVLCLPGQRK